MSAHSPGPWHQGGDALLNNVYDAAGGHVVTITVHDAKEAFPANARIIVESPEMLALLQEVALGCVCHLGTPGERCWNCRRVALLKRIDGAAKDADPTDAENAEDDADYDGCPNCGAWNRNACGCRR